MSSTFLLPSALADGRKKVSSTPALANFFLTELNIIKGSHVAKAIKLHFFFYPSAKADGNKVVIRGLFLIYIYSANS